MTRAAHLHAALDRLEAATVAARAQMDQERRLPPSLATALVDSGLNKLWVPHEYGGTELDLPASLEVFEHAARLDGTLGWALTIGVGGGLFAAWLPDETAAEIYAPPDALIAGSGSPDGRLSRRGEGYRVSGRWRWASGIDRATWVTASCVDQASAGTAVRAVAVPVASVRVHETWDTAALRGTASHDVEMVDVEVPARRVFDLAAPPRIDRSLYRFPFFQAAEASFAAATLGMARGAVDAWRTAMRTRHIDRGLAVDQRDVQARLARVEGALGAARSGLHDSATKLWETVAAGRTPSPEAVLTVTVAAVHAARGAVGAVAPLLETAGMAPLAVLDPLGRFWRDLQAAARHGLISAQRESELGAALL